MDAGGGNTILRRLREAGIDWKQTRDIFVTHKHIDHILGIVSFIAVSYRFCLFPYFLFSIITAPINTTATITINPIEITLSIHLTSVLFLIRNQRFRMMDGPYGKSVHCM